MSIEVLNESGDDVDVSGLSRLSRFVMDQMRVHPLAELCIKLVDEDTMAQLNEQWMEKTGPTDVLAFPMDELRPGLVNEEPEEGVLGDLVLCASVAGRQAQEAGHPTRERDPAADRPRHPAPARLRPRGARGAQGDVRPPGRAARGVAGRQAVSLIDVWLLVVAAVFAVVAGLFSSADAALSSFSKARALELSAQGVPGSARLLVIAEDPPRYLNTALFLGCSPRSPPSCWSRWSCWTCSCRVGGRRRDRRPTRAGGSRCWSRWP